MIRGADLSHADICEISTELEAEENLDPQPPGHVHHHRRGRLRRQLSEAHRHPSPTVLSHQRDWPGRDVGAEQCRGTVRPACGTCAALLQSLGRPGCSGRRNCNVNLDELRGDGPDLDCEPQQAGGILRNLQLDETTETCSRKSAPLRPGARSRGGLAGDADVAGVTADVGNVHDRRGRPLLANIDDYNGTPCGVGWPETKIASPVVGRSPNV
jgi:hypothetical protein